MDIVERGDDPVLDCLWILQVISPGRPDRVSLREGGHATGERAPDCRV